MEENDQEEIAFQKEDDSDVGEPIFTKGDDIPVGKLLIQTRDKKQFSVDQVKLLQEIKYQEFYSCLMNESEQIEFMKIVAKDNELKSHIASMFTIPTIKHTLFIEPADDDFLSVLGEKIMVRQENTDKMIHTFVNTSYLRFMFSDERKYCHVINSVYKNDPAEIIDIDVQSEKALIRVLPRLNLPELNLRVKKPILITPEIFNERELETQTESINLVSRNDIMLKTIKYKNNNFASGNLILVVQIHDLQVEGVHLKPEQLEAFSQPLEFENIEIEENAPKSRLQTIIPALTGHPYDPKEEDEESDEIPMPDPDPSIDDDHGDPKLIIETSSSSSENEEDDVVVFTTKDDNSDSDSQKEKSDDEDNSKVYKNNLELKKEKDQNKKANKYLAQTNLNVKWTITNRVPRKSRAVTRSVPKQLMLRPPTEEVSIKGQEAVRRYVREGALVSNQEGVFGVVTAATDASPGKQRMATVLKSDNRPARIPTDELTVERDDNTVRGSSNERIFVGDYVQASGPKVPKEAEGVTARVSHTFKEFAFAVYAKKAKRINMWTHGSSLTLKEDDKGPVGDSDGDL